MDVNAMWHEDPHLTDQDLALAADGELPAGRSAEVSAHLTSCWSCRARMGEMERAIADLVHLRREDLDAQLPPIAGPRALLRARLAEAGRSTETSIAARFRSLLQLPTRHSYSFAAISAAVVLVLAIGLRATWHPAGTGATISESIAEPRPQFTPGATVARTREDVCRSSPFSQPPAVPIALRQQIFQEYGITNPQPDAYEVDYLITPELGGATNIRNLWPQPYYNTTWHARIKDQLEDRLHTMVCDGEMDLTTAQHEIATDWIAAYKKYFHTDRPLVEARPKAHSKMRQREPVEDDPSPQHEPYAAVLAAAVDVRSRLVFVMPGRLQSWHDSRM